MPCPYLASYRQRSASPNGPADDNVCFAAGTQYWDYAPVSPTIQEKLCFKARSHVCHRFQKAQSEDHPYPDGARPSQSARGVAAKPWWKVWG